MRFPIVIGSFYEKSFPALTKQIENCFYHKLGPGDLPAKRRNENLLGVIAPHAAYQFSGICQAWAYKEIAESTFPKTFIILGPNHIGIGPDIAVSAEKWETPIGEVRNNLKLAEELKKHPIIEIDEEPHLQEHSIEVQLPFLQYANRDNLDKLRILPILIKNINLETAKKLGEILSKTEDTTVIVSSDFTHYGPTYSYTPFAYNIKENIKNLDTQAINLIKELNTENFLDFIQKTKATICGAAPIAVLLEYLKRKNCEQKNLLCYYTSGNMLKDHKNSVSYASMSFY